MRPRRPDLLPVLVLAGLFLLFGVGYLAFPIFDGAMKHNSCIASGRTDC